MTTSTAPHVIVLATSQDRRVHKPSRDFELMAPSGIPHLLSLPPPQAPLDTERSTKEWLRCSKDWFEVSAGRHGGIKPTQGAPQDVRSRCATPHPVVIYYIPVICIRSIPRCLRSTGDIPPSKNIQFPIEIGVVHQCY